MTDNTTAVSSNRTVNEFCRQILKLIMTGNADIKDAAYEFLIIAISVVLVTRHALAVTKRLMVEFRCEHLIILRVAIRAILLLFRLRCEQVRIIRNGN
jgi:hypothetical protein